MAKIAKQDAESMNKLYGMELAKNGIKFAGQGDPQAFADHQEYMDTLEGILKGDDKTSWEPNDLLLD